MNANINTLQALVDERNLSKFLFTAGPASLLLENLAGIRPCFGRGDKDYAQVEEQVLSSLKVMSGHQHIARMQGSASLALEIMALNFLYGRVLVVSTGYYSERLRWLSESASRRIGAVKEVVSVGWQDLDNVVGPYDWVFACSTETSCGLMLSVASLSRLAKRLNASLMLDATASIGLEADHDLADVIAYSSCKGLFGLTGASFIAFNQAHSQEVDSFYLNLATHLEKRMTGPYHAIASLVEVLPKHEEFRAAVAENKAYFIRKMETWLTVPPGHQPLLCTHVSCELEATDERAVLYKPRSDLGGSVVCHLGEVHLGKKAKGHILDTLTIAATSNEVI